MRNFISANRYPIGTILISLFLLALDVAADYFFTNDVRLDIPLDFSRPTHIDQDVTIREGTRYWLNMQFARREQRGNEQGKAFDDERHVVASYPVTLGLHKSRDSRKLVDQQFEVTTYSEAHLVWSPNLATPDLEFGWYHLHIEMPAVPELASEKAHLVLKHDPKGPVSPQMNAVILGAIALAFVFAPAAFIALILLVTRTMVVVLRRSGFIAPLLSPQ